KSTLHLGAEVDGCQYIARRAEVTSAFRVARTTGIQGAFVLTHPISLALQGGGSRGAFTWGVLDRLLEDERIAIEAFSGTSAGAINAAVCVAGYAEAGAAGARQALDKFWLTISEYAVFSPM